MSALKKYSRSIHSEERRKEGRGREREEGRKRGRKQKKQQQLKDTEQVEGTMMNNDCHGLYSLKLISEKRKQIQDIGPRHPWSWGGHEAGSMPIGINGFLAC